MKKNKLLLTALFFGLAFIGYSQDIIQKSDNSVINCRVIEIGESMVIYKLWDQLTGPNRSIFKSSIVKIIYENGQVEFFGEGGNQVSNQIIEPEQKPINSNSIKTSSPSISNSTPQKKEEKFNYAPSRFTIGFNSLGYVSGGFDAESKLISDFLNIGFGYWGHTFSSISDYTFYSFKAYTSLYAPINKLTGNKEKINRGFYPFFQPGVDMVLQFPETGGTSFTAGFIWRVGVDYKFTDGFGISYSYSTGSLNNFGILWNW
jgi:hypothetical protein